MHGVWLLRNSNGTGSTSRTIYGPKSTIERSIHLLESFPNFTQARREWETQHCLLWHGTWSGGPPEGTHVPPPSPHLLRAAVQYLHLLHRRCFRAFADRHHRLTPARCRKSSPFSPPTGCMGAGPLGELLSRLARPDTSSRT